MNVKPLGNRVLVKTVEAEEKSSGGIYIPPTAQEKTQEGIVIAIGDSEDINVKVNNRIIYDKYAGTNLKIEDIEQVYINAPDTVEVGQEVFFDGRKTNISDFKIYKYYWDFGDGRKTRGIEARHIYTTRGNYIIQLGVVSKNDRDGNSEKRGTYKNVVVVGSFR